MFRKILIANRGEIAVRVIRACREMGISPVAIYSDADRQALHVQLADEAYAIGPAPSAESYLVIEKVIAAARQSGAEAIHPGYGFLSENAQFVRAVEAAGLTFIGPSAQAMEIMGDKIRARQAAEQAKAPIVPGTQQSLASLDEAFAVADQIGYPVMLKAAAGGGGKGMRQVGRREDLASAYNLARSEASAAFRDATVYLEKFIERPRHIEIQVLGDRYGNYVYLGERECSIQRRNQKVIEECPSPINSAELRRRMGEAAIKIARQVEYFNAGTVEFLVDPQLNFYFLEMNTRLQVEHPVTELVTGIDLVREQFHIAQGGKLRFQQSDIQLRGAAIECRIYAEDANKNFMPHPGLITRLQPPSGPGIREDSGIYSGYEVPIYYDPLLSKLSVWAGTRAEAIDRLRRALDEYIVEGVKTTIPFFRQVLAMPDFINANLDTGFIARNWPPATSSPDDPVANTELADLAAIIAVIQQQHQQTPALSSGNAPSEHSATTDAAWKLSVRYRGWR